MADEKTPALWVHIMLSEIEAFDESLFAPSEPPAANETLVGMVDEPLLRKMWSLLRYYRRECDQAKVEVNYVAQDSPDRQPLYERILMSHTRAEILQGIFWLSVRDKFGLWARGYIGFRQGWKVVLVPQNNLPPFIQQLLNNL